MIEVRVSTNTARKTVLAETSDTVMSVFDKLGVNTNKAMINIDGTILSASDLDLTFEAHGVKDGTSIRLNSVVKGDGGSF